MELENQLDIEPKDGKNLTSARSPKEEQKQTSKPSAPPPANPQTKPQVKPQAKPNFAHNEKSRDETETKTTKAIKKKIKTKDIIVVFVIIIILALLGWGGWQAYKLLNYKPETSQEQFKINEDNQTMEFINGSNPQAKDISSTEGGYGRPDPFAPYK